MDAISMINFSPTQGKVNLQLHHMNYREMQNYNMSRKANSLIRSGFTLSMCHSRSELKYAIEMKKRGSKFLRFWKVPGLCNRVNLLPGSTSPTLIDKDTNGI